MPLIPDGPAMRPQLPNILVRNDADNAELMRLRAAALAAREQPRPEAKP